MSGTIELRGGSFRGLLLDNEANAERQGSGFNPLCHLGCPGRNLFRDDAVGLNFEHVMNGAAADAPRSMFTPRKDRCLLISHSPGEASVRHPAADSSWGIESEMRYRLGPDCVDMEFTARLTDERCAPLGYVAFMWASYMNRARGRDDPLLRDLRRGGRLGPLRRGPARTAASRPAPSPTPRPIPSRTKMGPRPSTSSRIPASASSCRSTTV